MEFFIESVAFFFILDLDVFIIRRFATRLTGREWQNNYASTPDLARPVFRSKRETVKDGGFSKRDGDRRESKKQTGKSDIPSPGFREWFFKIILLTVHSCVVC